MGKRYRRAKRAMRPDRVLTRLFTGGRHTSVGGFAKSVAGLAKPKPVARMTQANHDRMAAGKKPTAKKSAAKSAATRKPSARRSDSYEAARQIPVRNRAAAAAAAKKPVAPRKSTAIRLANGKFNGREAMNPLERQHFERLEARAGVPEQQMRPLFKRKGG